MLANEACYQTILRLLTTRNARTDSVLSGFSHGFFASITTLIDVR